MFGITLRATSSAPSFWKLVDEAAQFEQASSIRALGYPPHITLARYPEISLSLLREAAASLGSTKPIALTFDRIGLFDVDPVILWLSPQADQHLLEAHGRVHETAGPSRCDPHYRPGQWIPHLTLAMSIAIQRRALALEFAARPFEPFGLTFDVVECVSWPPVRVLEAWPLRG
jgi:2'-5' RNA ligase